MPKTIMTMVLSILACSAMPMLLSPARAQAVSPKQPPHYSVKTTLASTLLEDPEAVEILKKYIPTVYANDMFKQNAHSITLADVQQYEPDALSDTNLAKIQAESDKLPPKD